MAASSSSFFSFPLVFFCLYAVAYAQLSPTFYSASCPLLLPTVRIAVRAAVLVDARLGASLLRLHFHDCFVNGCDASVLLDNTANFTGEKTAVGNNNSLRGFEVIDAIKAAVEVLCPGVVSCADILTLAAHDSVVILGGPTWTVPLGRRDSTTASLADANNSLPAPILSLNDLLQSFNGQVAQGVQLDITDLVALSGAHTIGQARCTNFRGHIYNDRDINAAYATSLGAVCPRSGGDDNLAPLDPSSPIRFDNAYYTNILNNRSLLHSDQELLNGGTGTLARAANLVRTYAANQATFFTDFANAMIKMGNIRPLTGSSGEIRANCRLVS